MKQRASELIRESKALEGIAGAAILGEEKKAEAGNLLGQARDLEQVARLEDITVWEDCIVKQAKKGERKYGRWLAGWREGERVRKVYLGSCKKMSHDEALEKARTMKAEGLWVHP